MTFETLQKLVDEFGEVRITKHERTVMKRTIDENNNVVEKYSVNVSYEVAVRNHSVVEEPSLDAALERIK